MFPKNLEKFRDKVKILRILFEQFKVFFFSPILFWNIEKWMFGPLGQANSPLTENYTLYLFIVHRQCNRFNIEQIDTYLFSVKELWGQLIEWACLVFHFSVLIPSCNIMRVRHYFQISNIIFRPFSIQKVLRQYIQSARNQRRNIFNFTCWHSDGLIIPSIPGSYGFSNIFTKNVKNIKDFFYPVLIVDDLTIECFDHQ